MTVQNILITEASLTTNELKELQQWWHSNYHSAWEKNDNRVFIIPLENRYVDFQLRKVII